MTKLEKLLEEIDPSRSIDVVEKNINNEKDKFNLMPFVSKMKDDDNYPLVVEKVIDKKAILPRIMMCMYFANKYLDDPYLTTKQIEDITKELGIKIIQSKSGHKINNKQKYFDSSAAKKRGVTRPSKLKRNGIKEFERIINE